MPPGLWRPGRLPSRKVCSHGLGDEDMVSHHPPRQLMWSLLHTGQKARASSSEPGQVHTHRPGHIRADHPLGPLLDRRLICDWNQVKKSQSQDLWKNPAGRRTIMCHMQSWEEAAPEQLRNLSPRRVTVGRKRLVAPRDCK